MCEPIKYFVNKEKGIVVAVLEKCETDFYFYMRENDLGFAPYGSTACWMKDKYIGKAKCCSSDDFDEEYGKELARTRLLLRYYEDFTKLFYSYKEERNKRIKELSEKPLAHYEHLVDRMIELEKDF